MKTILPQANGRTNSGPHSPAIRFPELASQSAQAPARWSSGRTVFAESQTGGNFSLLEDSAGLGAEVLSTTGEATSLLGSVRALRTAQIQGTLAVEADLTKAPRPAPAFYMNLPESSGPEGFVLGLVAGAAFLAIAYSFFCGIQLIQHWALFSAGIGKLIQ